MKLKQLHYFSGIILAAFTGPHLLNHIIAIYSIDKHIEMMNSLRLFYRNIFIETILLMAVALQIISGLKLFNRNKNVSMSFFEKLHLRSGLYLAFFLIMHVTAVLTGRLLLNLDTNFYFGAVGLNMFPFTLLFFPYYGLAILSFFGHIASIHHRKTKIIMDMNPTTQSYAILAFGFIIMIAVFYGMTDGFKGVAIPKEYQLLLGQGI